MKKFRLPLLAAIIMLFFISCPKEDATTPGDEATAFLSVFVAGESTGIIDGMLHYQSDNSLIQVIAFDPAASAATINVTLRSGLETTGISVPLTRLGEGVYFGTFGYSYMSDVSNRIVGANQCDDTETLFINFTPSTGSAIEKTLGVTNYCT